MNELTRKAVERIMGRLAGARPQTRLLDMLSREVWTTIHERTRDTGMVQDRAQYKISCSPSFWWMLSTERDTNFRLRVTPEGASFEGIPIVEDVLQATFFIIHEPSSRQNPAV